MRSTRYATSRQKACKQCSSAKARCDRKTGGCSRCAQRGLSCTYLQDRSPGTSVQNVISVARIEPFSPTSSSNTLRETDGLLSDLERELLSRDHDTPSTQEHMIDDTSINFRPVVVTKTHISVDPSFNTAPNVPGETETFDFTGLQLVCPINADDISNRWLNSFIPTPGQTIKNYPPKVASFIYRILKSYTTVAVRGRGVPPFVHYLQTTTLQANPPLSTCLSLARMCDKPLPGSESAVAEVIQREMNNLYESRDTYDDMCLLAAFQAYLIYAMLLYFRLSQGSNPFLRQAVMSLQELACSTSRQGLVCKPEQQHTRPRWEDWVVAEAKRRTLFTMYLFDSTLSSEDGLPTFFGTELEGLPAPANRSLWLTRIRRDWEAAYNTHLAEWAEGGLRIDELWPIPVGLDDSSLSSRRRKVDDWLEDVDEFGTMLYAVTSCTHGG
ncbi:Fc.00g003950.m01.CDS01 [Cosmosporella sp. VM-42]